MEYRRFKVGSSALGIGLSNIGYSGLNGIYESLDSILKKGKRS